MGIPTLIDTLTASGDATLEDTSSMTSAYDEYMFVCTDLNPDTDDPSIDFLFQVNVDGESDYNELITSTGFFAYNAESGGTPALTYKSDIDQAQGTAFQGIANNIGYEADESTAGILHIFSPSNTTYVTHFYSRFQDYAENNYAQDVFVAGYINATGAITDIQFKMTSGNFDGVIQVYGIS